MIAVPAVDIRGGSCVQLVGGSYADERVRLADPEAVARTWASHGFQRLHVVDLDAATGVGDNASLVENVTARTSARTQIGGGVRDDARVDRLFAVGADRVVVGTRAIEDPVWLARQADRYPGRLVVAADVREGLVAVHGWTATRALRVSDVLRVAKDLPLAGFLITAIDVEGRMSGPDLALMAYAVRVSTRPIIASGGIGSIGDLRALAAIGVESAIIGMALYTGALDASDVAAEFGS